MYVLSAVSKFICTEYISKIDFNKTIKIILRLKINYPNKRNTMRKKRSGTYTFNTTNCHNTFDSFFRSVKLTLFPFRYKIY